MINPDIYGGVALPEHEDYAHAILQTIISEHITSHASMVYAMEKARASSVAYRRFMGLMAQVGMLIEPVDQTTKQLVDNEQKTTEAVMLGSALGGLVVPKVHGSVVNLDTFEINLPKKIWESEDSPDARYMLSEYLFRYGDYGFTVMGSKAEDVLEETESLVVSDVTKQRMFRIGCGIVVHASLETHIRHNEKKAEEDRRRLAEQLDQPDAIDWSSDIYDLLRMKDD